MSILLERFEAPEPQSKRIAVLAVFTSISMLLEVFPVPGITDLKLVPQVPSFTIDWTGIPLSFILLGLGLTYSLTAVVGVGIAIGYRNPVGALFKVASETLTVLGMSVGFSVHRALRKRLPKLSKTRTLLVLAGGMLFRMVGMYVINIALLPVFVGLPEATAITVSGILVPWNGVQALINILGAWVLMALLPRELLLQAGLSLPAGEGDQIDFSDEG